MNKFQTGGSVNITYTANPFTALAQAPVTTSTTTTSDSGLISKNLLNKISGIPVDVDEIYSEISKLEQNEMLGIPVNKRAIHSLEASINRANQFSKYLEKAEERAVNNDALGEIAVGERGQLYFLSGDKKIGQVSMSDYNPEKHGAALTVNELIEHRKFNPNLAFDESVLKPISTNLGMSKINQYIQEIIKTVGSSDTTSEAYTELAGYVGKESAKKPTEELLSALQELYSIGLKIGMDAIFKRSDTISSKNINEALDYIQAVLPKTMQYLLSGRFIAQGGDARQAGTYMNALIKQALISSNDYTEKHLIDYNASMNKAAGTLAGQKEQNRNLGVLEQLVQGSLGKRDYKLINTKNPDYSLNLHGTGVGSLATFDNNIVDKSPLSVTLQAGLAPLVDEEHITIGNLKVTSGMFDTILYNGGDVINVWAPVNANGDIDLEGLLILSEIQSICDTNPQLTTEDKNALLQKYQLSGHFDETGKFIGDGNMAQFLVMTGLTSDEIVDASANPFADKLSKQEKKLEFDLLDRIYGQLNKNLRGGKYEFKTGLFKGTTDLYKVPIFMRLNQTAQIDAGTFSNKGPLVQTPSYQLQLAYDLMRNRLTTQIMTPSSSIL